MKRCVNSMRHGVCVLLAVTSAAAGERGPGCADAAERGQRNRAAGKVASAREDFIVCSATTCPEFIRTDCVAWLDELVKGQSTFVFYAKDESGSDLTRVKVSVDGQPLAETLNGLPIAIDPGEHTFRFEAQGFDTIEKKVLAVQYSKGRLLEIVMRRSAAVKIAPPADIAPPAESSRGSASPLPWIFGGVGVAALGVFTGFEIKGWNDYSTAESGCGVTRSCSDADLSSGRTSFRIAGAALGVSVVSFAAMAISLVLAPKSASTTGSTRAPGKVLFTF